MTAFCTGVVIPKAHTIIGEAKKRVDGRVGAGAHMHGGKGVPRGFRMGATGGSVGVPWGFRGVPRGSATRECGFVFLVPSGWMFHYDT